VAIAASFVALRQYRKQCESSEAERIREQEGRERERKEFASSLAAWVARDLTNTAEPKNVGVVLLNSSTVAFHQVEVTVKLGHGLSGRAGEEMTFTEVIVPPGRYFRQKNPASSQFSWGFATPIADGCQEKYQPLTGTDKYAVTNVRFLDPLGQLWETNQFGQLTLVRAN
jgi:hypothetical protein